MRLPAQFGAVIVLIAAVTGCLVGGYLAQTLFAAAYQQVIDNARLRVDHRPDLAYYLYKNEEQALTILLSDLTDSLPVGPAALYNTSGIQLAFTARGIDGGDNLPALEVLRGGASPAAMAEGVLRGSVLESQPSFWIAWRGDAQRADLTLPVVSALNPNRSDLSAEDFFSDALAGSRGSGGVVIGYVYFGVDLADIADRVWATVQHFLIVFAVCSLLGALLVFVIARKMTQQLAELRSITRRIQEDGVSEEIVFEGKGEFDEIATAFNELVRTVSRRSQELEVDRKLLSMKVDESETRLNEQGEELERASQEITEAHDKLHQMAYYDSLTKLPNRALFMEQFSQLLRLQVRDEKSLALLLVSVDNFRRVTESLGLEAGNRLLGESSSRLTACIRDADIIARNVDSSSEIEVSRLGDDEFAVVLCQLDDTASAGQVAARLKLALSDTVAVDGQEIVPQSSIGIACAPGDGATSEALVRAASAALHHSQAEGKNAPIYYHMDMDLGDSERFRLEAELRKALVANELSLHYQPQVNTSDGSISGAEALLRWEHPELGQVPPHQFIPIAEECGLMEDLGTWVLQEACRQLRELKDGGVELERVAVNVSSMEFGASFVERVKQSMATHGIHGGQLELGLSQGILLDQRADVHQCLRELSELGVYLSVDDFGAGAVPLGYLTQQPLDELKIDRSLVRECHRSTTHGRLIKAIIAMADNLDIRLLAEGVESEQEFRFLMANGVRSMQGYLFSKPVPVSELVEQLKVPWYYMSFIQRLSPND
ncbi:MAG: EAL domain-containing protein [Pseudomonadota bacterium]